MTKNFLVLLALIFSFGLGFGSLAAQAEATPPSLAAASKFAPLENLHATFYSLYHGPRISDPVSSAMTDGKSPHLMENSLILAYKYSAPITFSFNYNFLLVPLREKDYIFADPTIKAAHTKLFDNGKGTVIAGAARLYLPASASSRDGDLLTQFRLDETINHDVAGTKLSVGIDSTQRKYFWSSDISKGKPGKNSFYLYLGPYAAYQFTPSLGARAGFDKEMAAAFAENASFDTSAKMDGSVGLTWNATPKITLSPSLSYKPSDLKLSTTQFNFELIAKLF